MCTTHSASSFNINMQIKILISFDLRVWTTNVVRRLFDEHMFFVIHRSQLGNSPEFYLDHERSQEILSHYQILGEFGAETSLADDMLNDQGNLLL